MYLISAFLNLNKCYKKLRDFDFFFELFGLIYETIYNFTIN